MSCCRSPKAKEAIDFLESYNGFLPPITKAKDGHFTNPIHLLQYYDLLKILDYDAHCPSLEKDTYLRLCCPICQKYFPTLTFLTNHRKTAHLTTRGQSKAQSRDQTEWNSTALDDFSLPFSQTKYPVPIVYISEGE